MTYALHEALSRKCVTVLVHVKRQPKADLAKIVQGSETDGSEEPLSLFLEGSDRSIVAGENGLRRSRSYTLNAWMNSSMFEQGSGWGPANFKSMPQKMSQIVRPPPVGTFVFIDEHEASIDDGLWNTNPSGTPSQWDNLPAVRHGWGEANGPWRRLMFTVGPELVWPAHRSV